MNGTVFETGNGEQLLEYLKAQGMAVVVWNPTMDMVCSGCHAASVVDTKHTFFEDGGKAKRACIERELVRMGFRQGQSGFYNIVESILLITQMQRGQPIRVTSDIYPKVALRRGSTASSVERTIRNAIESVWKRSNLRTLQEMYPYPCDNLNGRPTNAEFLINMAGNFRE